MRWTMIIVMLLSVVILGNCTSRAKTPPSRDASETSAPIAKGPKLKMSYIRASSSVAVKRLRAMPIDIIRIRPDAERPPDKESLAGGFIVEAVVPADILPKLKAKGYEVSDVPPKNM